MSLHEETEKLDQRLKAAKVTYNEETETYQIFVPGALRENNTVKAENEAEALKKVRSVLLNKIEHNIDKEKSKDATNTELDIESVKQDSSAKLDEGGKNG